MSGTPGLEAGRGEGRTRQRTPQRDFLVVLVMLAVLAASATVALRTVSLRLPPPDIDRTPDLGRLGYTLSLALFFLPSATIAGWFWHAPRFAIERRAFWITVGIGLLFGCLLDVGFGNSFLVFRNPRATLGVFLPGWSPGQGWLRNIPLEEFLFYGLGFIAIVLIYVWGNLYWFGAYCADDLRSRAPEIPRLIRPRWSAVAVVAGLLAAGYAYRYLGPPRHMVGFPGYFTFLVCAGALPSLLFFDAAKPFINWRALSFTVFALLFISLLWEVTLGVPYAWWGYRDAAMLGLFIEAWSHLPIEAVMVWVAACYGAIITYETVRLIHYSGRPAWRALMGPARGAGGTRGYAKPRSTNRSESRTP